ncbi:MAG: aminopeptidase [Candidatus Hermodarchaeota archaeon]
MSSSFARQIVRDALRIRDQERVWVHTWNHSLDLAQEIIEQAQLHGAAVVLSVTSESSVTHLMKKAPQEAVTTPSDHWLSGVTKSNALIVLDGPEDPGIFKNADISKVLGVTSQITRLLGTAFFSQVRTLFVRTTGFTEKAAKTYGISQTNLMNESNRTLTANQAEIIELGQHFERLLNQYREIHLSSSEGTNLRFRTRGKPRIDDGIIDQADIQNKNVFTQLPAGTITIPIDESSAEGSVIFNLPRGYLGDTIQNLRLDFKKGQITDTRVLKGAKTIESALHTGTESKDRLTRLTFGINPGGSTTFGQHTDTLIPGTLTLGLGDNTYIGGRSQSNLIYDHTLNDAIVSIGPTAVIMEGKLTF